MDLNETHALKQRNEKTKTKLLKDSRDSSSRGKNARLIERLAESAKGVIMHFTKVCK